MHGGKKVQNRHDQRLEFTHGANNFLYFKDEKDELKNISEEILQKLKAKWILS